MMTLPTPTVCKNPFIACTALTICQSGCCIWCETTGVPEAVKQIAALVKQLETVKRWLEFNQRDKSILYKPVCAAIESAKVSKPAGNGT